MDKHSLELTLIATGVLGFLAFVLKVYLHYIYLEECKSPLESMGIQGANQPDVFLRFRIVLPYLSRNHKAEQRKPQLQKKAKWIMALSILFVALFCAMVLLSNLVQNMS